MIYPTELAIGETSCSLVFDVSNHPAAKRRIVQDLEIPVRSLANCKVIVQVWIEGLTPETALDNLKVESASDAQDLRLYAEGDAGNW